MSFKYITSAACACLLSITVTQSLASVTYTYTGNQFNEFSSPSSYDNTMSVNMTIELDSALQNTAPITVTPLSFMITDGINTITQDNVSLSEFIFSASAGTIIEWRVQVDDIFAESATVYRRNAIRSEGSSVRVTDSGQIQTCTLIGLCDIIFVPDPGEHYARVNDMPGAWAIAPVPVPPAVWLFGSGLIGLIEVARRKVRV